MGSDDKFTIVNPVRANILLSDFWWNKL